MKQVVHSDAAPAAVGPYSQAIHAAGLIFTAGQIPLRADGTMNDGDIEVQTRQVLENLRAVLEAAGSSLERVVKCTVFLADMDDFAAMNGIYGQFFGEMPPARSAVEVARLPKGARIEIECVALAGS